MNYKKKAVCAWVCLGLLSGCASTPTPPSIRDGEAVLFVMASSPPTDSSVGISNQAFGKGVAAGAGSGTVVGGLWGLTCGPLAILCVPLGAMLGLATGTVAGAAVGMTGALTSEQAARVRERLSQVRRSHDLLAELQSQITSRAQRHWTVGNDASAHQVTVTLQDLQLSSTRDEQLSIVMQVTVAVRLRGRAQTTEAKQYGYVGPFSPMAVWMDEGSDFIDTSLSSASQQIAAQIVSELALK
ncbi:hypothetical protein BH11PSE10_BH11PSE10_14590 [soil metagenome]